MMPPSPAIGIDPGWHIGRRRASSLGVLVASIAITCGCAAETPTYPTPAKPAPGRAATLELSASPMSGANAGQATVTARVKDAYAYPVKGVSVELQTTIGSVSPATIVSDENGVGVAMLTAPAGTGRVTGTVAGMSVNASALVTIQISTALPTPNPTPPDAGPGPSGSLTVTLSATTATLGTGTVFTAFVSGGSPRTFEWSFGDGSTFNGVSSSAAHTYAAIGAYPASV
jgi:hypothetical protein